MRRINNTDIIIDWKGAPLRAFIDMKRILKAVSAVLCLCLIFSGCTTKAEKQRMEEQNRINAITEQAASAGLAIVPVIDQDPETVFVYGWEAVKLEEGRYLAGYAYDTENSLKDDGYCMYAKEYRAEGEKFTASEPTDEALYKEHGITLYKAPEGISVSAGYYTDSAALIKEKRLLLSAMGTFFKVFGVQPYLYTETDATFSAEELAQKKYAERFTAGSGETDGMHILVAVQKAADGKLAAACKAGDAAKELLGEGAESLMAELFSKAGPDAESFTNDACTAFYSAVLKLYSFKEAASSEGAEKDIPEKLTLVDTLAQTTEDALPVISFSQDGNFTGKLNLYQGMYEISGTYRAAKDIFGNTALICTVSSDGGNAFGGQQFCFTKLTGTKSWLYLGNTMGMVWDRSIFQ